MSERLDYDVVVVGGGPAGATTALYTTRLGHRTAVFEREGGRHSQVREVHNLYGVSERVSGEELSAHAADQLREYGADYHVDPVRSVERLDDGAGESGDDEADADGSGDGESDTDGSDAEGAEGDGAALVERPRFRVEATHATVNARRIAFATGFSDVEPGVPELERFAGRGLHYCLHCDAYTLGDSQVFVLGHDDHAARVAMLMLNLTTEVDLLLNGAEPTWEETTERQLAAHPVERIDRAVDGAFPREHADGERDEGSSDGAGEEPWLGGLRFVDGTERSYRGGFAVYGKEYNTTLPEALGCELTDDGAVAVDEDGETSVDGAYAVGDVTHGQNQTAIALADGARAGIAIHKDLRPFPRSADEIEDGATVPESAVPAAPADLRARMRGLRERGASAGLRGREDRE